MPNDYAGIQELLLDLADERDPDGVLDLVAERLAAEPYIALAGVWLIRDGRLDAVAHAGRGHDLPGALTRIPLGDHPIARAAAGESVAAAPASILAPDRSRAEPLVGFCAEPLLHDGTRLGALGAFTRAALGDALPAVLRLVADHAAAALVNARGRATLDRRVDALGRERDALRAALRDARGFDRIVGASLATRSVLRQVGLAAATDAPVLITGEAGTGKTLVAFEIHRESARRGAPLIAIDASEGVVNDATARAADGTVVIERVDTAPAERQRALERAIDAIDARVIATTRRDLRTLVAAGRFRERLYYALDTFSIGIAPLRERPEDIAPLARHFAERLARRHGRDTPHLARADLDALARHAWHGNAHALHNAIERAVLAAAPGAPLRIPVPADPAEHDVLSDAAIRRLERDNITRALAHADGKLYGDGGAADLLGVKPTTLAHRIAAMGIRRPRRRSVR